MEDKFRECTSCGFHTQCFEVPRHHDVTEWYCAICLPWRTKHTKHFGSTIIEPHNEPLLELISYGINSILERLD